MISRPVPTRYDDFPASFLWNTVAEIFDLGMCQYFDPPVTGLVVEEQAISKQKAQTTEFIFKLFETVSERYYL